MIQLYFSSYPNFVFYAVKSVSYVYVAAAAGVDDDGILLSFYLSRHQDHDRNWIHKVDTKAVIDASLNWMLLLLVMTQLPALALDSNLIPCHWHAPMSWYYPLGDLYNVVDFLRFVSYWIFLLRDVAHPGMVPN